jgi:hypothetical protein
MITHSRLVPADAGADVVDATTRHIIDHLLSVADPDDDPTNYHGVVTIKRHDQTNGVLLVGSLDAEPQADYLRQDFDPERDVAANPLSVPSILDAP